MCILSPIWEIETVTALSWELNEIRHLECCHCFWHIVNKFAACCYILDFGFISKLNWSKIILVYLKCATFTWSWEWKINQEVGFSEQSKTKLCFLKPSLLSLNSSMSSPMWWDLWTYHMAGYPSKTHASQVALLALPLSALMLRDYIIFCFCLFLFWFLLSIIRVRGDYALMNRSTFFFISSRTLTQAYEQLARGLWAIHFTFLSSFKHESYSNLVKAPSTSKISLE